MTVFFFYQVFAKKKFSISHLLHFRGKHRSYILYFLICPNISPNFTQLKHYTIVLKIFIGHVNIWVSLGVPEKRDPGPWDDHGSTTPGGFRTLWGPRTLGRPRTLGGPRTLWRPRTLWGPRTLGGQRILGGSRTLWGPKTRIILPIKYSVWLKYPKISYFIWNLWRVNLSFFVKTSILYLMTASITRKIHIFKLFKVNGS